MKRFTETTKWRDKWFRRLSPTAKLLWIYLTDNCDCTGLIDLDLDAVRFDIGEAVKEKHLTELESRTQRLPDGKLYITKFIPFQYGTLSESCPAHKPVLKLVNDRKLIRSELGFKYPIDPTPIGYQIPTGQEKEKEKEKEEGGMGGGVTNGTYTTESRVALAYLNEKSGKAFRESETSLGPINARMKEPDVTIEGVKQMIDRQCAMWKDSRMAEFLRPSTLFGKEKFNEYYAARAQPIRQNYQPIPSTDRNFGVKQSAAAKGAEIADVLRRRELAKEMAQAELPSSQAS